MRSFFSNVFIVSLLAVSNFAFAQTEEIDQATVLSPEELVQYCKEQANEQGLEAEEAKAFIEGCSAENTEENIEENTEEKVEQSTEVEAEESPEKP